MKLEDMKTIDLSASQPPEDMTDEQWQAYFSSMRKLVVPEKESKMRFCNSPMTANGRSIEGSYDGETQWQRYCIYINDVLSQIRHKKKDYCYNIYQITDLLKYEHDRLETRWLPDVRAFEVWLKKN